ncbi:hypothetical protein M514_18744 [Trichuris suis]|uniref:Uncharacterized protein n=1 Tax=Trichuris suis TaxID=68888 RepID=A0A085NI71_9BILA|nr:hypothetical protein M514_18744 [Trichuris suis]
MQIRRIFEEARLADLLFADKRTLKLNVLKRCVVSIRYESFRLLHASVVSAPTGMFDNCGTVLGLFPWPALAAAFLACPVELFLCCPVTVEYLHALIEPVKSVSFLRANTSWKRSSLFTSFSSVNSICPGKVLFSCSKRASSCPLSAMAKMSSTYLLKSEGHQAVRLRERYLFQVFQEQLMQGPETAEYPLAPHRSDGECMMHLDNREEILHIRAHHEVIFTDPG